MIKSFRNSETERLWKKEFSRRFPASIHKAAFRKLQMLNAAAHLADLKVPPGNRLEPLQGSRKGQHRIRVNDQYRICFTWREANAHDVEITEYH